MMKSILTFLLSTTSLCANAQELYKCDSTRSFWTFNQDNALFYVKVLGNVDKTERTNVISVGHLVLQSLIVDKTKFVKEGEDNADVKIMIRHAMSEAEYLSNVFKTKIDIRMTQAPISANRSVLIWSFEMPPGHNQEVKSQLFANIVVEGKIFGLASPQFAEQKFEDVRDSLMDVISTIKAVAGKSDFDKLCGK